MLIQHPYKPQLNNIKTKKFQLDLFVYKYDYKTIDIKNLTEK